MNVFLEIGKKRTFAGAVEWPGWCRSAKDEPSALQVLLDYAPRYARAIQPAGLDFQAPQEVSAFSVVERLAGNSGTDFGAPIVPPSSDALPTSPPDLQRLKAVMQAMWRTFDEVFEAAQGRQLQTGPRGGGRDQEHILRHVLEAEVAYLSRLGGKLEEFHEMAEPRLIFRPLRRAILLTLEASARGELPLTGPRGGKRWTARFFTRYAAWHVLDHTWELEDRLV